MARDLNKIPTIDELRIALEKCGCSLRPYDMVLLNNYLENLTIENQGSTNIVKYLDISEFPDVGDEGTLYVTTNDSSLYVWNDGAYLQMSGGGSGDGEDSDKNFVHMQGVPSDIWMIVHTLNKYPSVTVIDSGGTEIIGNIKYIDTLTIIITFASGFSGKAILN